MFCSRNNDLVGGCFTGVQFLNEQQAVEVKEVRTAAAGTATAVRAAASLVTTAARSTRPERPTTS